jgi:hypothetical protein
MGAGDMSTEVAPEPNGLHAATRMPRWAFNHAESAGVVWSVSFLVASSPSVIGLP